jgi:hypothetical protein
MSGPNSLRELVDQASARRFLDVTAYEPRSLSEPMPFPFMAIVAQREMKLALLLALVNPAISGVLLVGPRGPAKTTAVRSLSDLLPFVNRSMCQYGCLPEDIETGGMDALKAMTIEDAKGIVLGGNTAGTEFFKRKTSMQVSDAFRPVIEKAMAHTGVQEKFTALMGSAPKLPFGKSPTMDINGYVLEKSVDGMFTMMGEEEKKIRTNPASQVTPLLKMVFGRR